MFLFYAFDVKNMNKCELFLLRKTTSGVNIQYPTILASVNLKIPDARKVEKKKNFHTEDTNIGPNRTQLMARDLCTPGLLD
jgi:hypothetical protein